MSSADRPVCDCHGEPKVWAKDKRRAAGGYCRCLERKREAQRRYGHTEKGLEASSRYYYSPKGRARLPKKRATDRLYCHSSKGLARDIRQRRKLALIALAELQIEKEAILRDLSRREES